MASSVSGCLSMRSSRNFVISPLISAPLSASSAEYLEVVGRSTSPRDTTTGVQPTELGMLLEDSCESLFIRFPANTAGDPARLLAFLFPEVVPVDERLLEGRLRVVVTSEVSSSLCWFCLLTSSIISFASSNVIFTPYFFSADGSDSLRSTFSSLASSWYSSVPIPGTEYFRLCGEALGNEDPSEESSDLSISSSYTTLIVVPRDFLPEDVGSLSVSVDSSSIVFRAFRSSVRRLS